MHSLASGIEPDGGETGHRASGRGCNGHISRVQERGKAACLHASSHLEEVRLLHWLVSVRHKAPPARSHGWNVVASATQVQHVCSPSMPPYLMLEIWRCCPALPLAMCMTGIQRPGWALCAGLYSSRLAQRSGGMPVRCSTSPGARAMRALPHILGEGLSGAFQGVYLLPHLVCVRRGPGSRSIRGSPSFLLLLSSISSHEEGAWRFNHQPRAGVISGRRST